MTEPGDQYQIMFDDLIAARGGLSALSPIHLEICSVICRLLIAVRGADDAREVPKTAALVSSLTAMLPLPIEPGAPVADLSRLSDAQIEQLEMLSRVANGEIDPQVAPITP